MGRKSKDPEIRRMELILAAEQLFKEKGYEDTLVSDITDKVGVSHGAFFYYFESKNDILKAVINYYVGLDKELISTFVNDDSKSAIKKIQAILDVSMSNENAEISGNKLVEYLHKDGNESLYSEYVKKTQEVIIPLITSIVEQGIKEGTFDVPYPKETVEYILHLFNECQHALKNASQSNDAYYRKVRAMEIILNRVMGMKEGGISLLTK